MLQSAVIGLNFQENERGREGEKTKCEGGREGGREGGSKLPGSKPGYAVMLCHSSYCSQHIDTHVDLDAQ